MARFLAEDKRPFIKLGSLYPKSPYYVLRHSHVIKWGAVIGHNDETGHPILLTIIHNEAPPDNPRTISVAERITVQTTG